VTERLKLGAVVLRTVDFGESDRVVTLLTRDRGKLGAFARGARASRKRFGGALEPFTLLTAELVSRSGGDLMTLESVQVERSFHEIRSDLARIACAAYATEVARELVREHEPHPGLHDLLVDYLGRLAAAPAAPAGLRAFELAALGEAGFQPRVDGCARCGGEVPPGEGAPFSVQDGGLLCHSCAPLAPPLTPRLSAEAVAALRALQAGGLQGSAAPAAAGAGRETREILGLVLEQLVGHRLQARRFLDEIGPLLAE